MMKWRQTAYLFVLVLVVNSGAFYRLDKHSSTNYIPIPKESLDNILLQCHGSLMQLDNEFETGTGS